MSANKRSPQLPQIRENQQMNRQQTARQNMNHLKNIAQDPIKPEDVQEIQVIIEEESKSAILQPTQQINSGQVTPRAGQQGKNQQQQQQQFQPNLIGEVRRTDDLTDDFTVTDKRDDKLDEDDDVIEIQRITAEASAVEAFRSLEETFIVDYPSASKTRFIWIVKGKELADHFNKGEKLLASKILRLQSEDEFRLEITLRNSADNADKTFLLVTPIFTDREREWGTNKTITYAIIIYHVDQNERFVENGVKQPKQKQFYSDPLPGAANGAATTTIVTRNNANSNELNFDINYVDEDSHILIEGTITLARKTYSNFKVPFCGLENQGNTCYMNSFLQMLFHLKAFRRLIFSFSKTEKDFEMNFPATLQHLFYDLMQDPLNGVQRTKSIKTTDLTKSFGWNLRDGTRQQDVQEFQCILFEAIQDTISKYYETSREQFSQLFQGKILQRIRCKDTSIKEESTKEEDFDDIKLNVKGLRDLHDSLNEVYGHDELLTGENQWDSGPKHGKQDAIKTLRFQSLPKVLLFHLKRFDYDVYTGDSRKIKDRYEYFQTIDMRQYMLDQNAEQIYDLFAVLVHSGAVARSGHYYVYIRTSEEEDSWYQFNDQTVEPVRKFAYVDLNFGGERDNHSFDPQTGRLKNVKMAIASTAYMLAYIRRDSMRQVMQDIFIESELPQWLQDMRTQRKREEDDRRRLENFYDLHITFMEKLSHDAHNGLAFSKDSKGEAIFDTKKRSVQLEIAKKGTNLQFLQKLQREAGLRIETLAFYRVCYSARGKKTRGERVTNLTPYLIGDEWRDKIFLDLFLGRPEYTNRLDTHYLLLIVPLQNYEYEHLYDIVHKRIEVASRQGAPPASQLNNQVAANTVDLSTVGERRAAMLSGSEEDALKLIVVKIYNITRDFVMRRQKNGAASQFNNRNGQGAAQQNLLSSGQQNIGPRIYAYFFVDSKWLLCDFIELVRAQLQEGISKKHKENQLGRVQFDFYQEFDYKVRRLSLNTQQMKTSTVFDAFERDLDCSMMIVEVTDDDSNSRGFSSNAQNDLQHSPEKPRRLEDQYTYISECVKIDFEPDQSISQYLKLNHDDVVEEHSHQFYFHQTATYQQVIQELLSHLDDSLRKKLHKDHIYLRYHQKRHLEDVPCGPSSCADMGNKSWRLLDYASEESKLFYAYCEYITAEQRPLKTLYDVVYYSAERHLQTDSVKLVLEREAKLIRFIEHFDKSDQFKDLVLEDRRALLQRQQSTANAREPLRWRLSAIDVSDNQSQIFKVHRNTDAKIPKKNTFLYRLELLTLEQERKNILFCVSQFTRSREACFETPFILNFTPRDTLPQVWDAVIARLRQRPVQYSQKVVPVNEDSVKMTISSDSKHLEILVQLPQALAEITLSDVLQLDNNNNATNTLSTFHIAVHHKNLYPREEALKKIKQD